MDIRLPRLGEGADSGTVATIFVKEGDSVKKDQPILELESEKAVASIPSPSAGRVTRIHIKEGDEIKVGALLASLQEEGAAAGPAAIDASVGDDADDDMPPAAPVTAPPVAAPVAPVAYAATLPEEFPVLFPAGTPPPAAPSIRKLAKQLGIDLARVKGSERGGRIVLADVKRYLARVQQIATQPRVSAATAAAAPSRPVAPSVDFSKWGKVSTKKLSTLRKAIANKMADSWTAVPRVTQFDEIDVTDLLALRKKYVAKYEKKGAHLTVTSIALKALAATLKKHPMFNSSLDLAAGEIVQKEYVHIGIAVDTEQGLIVPVLRDADKKDVLELSIELKSLAERTRDRKIGLDEMQGASFTVSNQGGIGSGQFTPIVNTPEVAILGMGKGVLKPVVREGKIVPRTLLPVALSYDHRAIDGADAARFMVDLVAAIESFKESDVKI